LESLAHQQAILTESTKEEDETKSCAFRCKTILIDGKQVSVQCSVISKDGKTMTTTIKDTDAKGKSIVGIVVLDKQ
jgi:hypothetical protein